ncbi:MAG: hypothetical protein RR839_03890 [Oscillospiraceae bacterium]
MNGFTFDYLQRYENPNIILAFQNKKTEGIFTPDSYKNLSLSLRFNAFSEISFTVKSHYNDRITETLVINPYYKLLKKNKLICLPDIGWFIINSLTENIEHQVTEKVVKCFSFEKSMESKSLNLLNGTYKFYNALNPKDTSTLIGKILLAIPSWKIGYVDEALWNKYRTFDIPDTNIYSFLMGDVEKAYECIFDFDTITQSINIFTAKSAVKKTDIVLTFDNLIKKIEIQELDTPIITALGVFGNGDLDIRNVNPTGSAIIYNWEHYYNDMSAELVSDIKTWQTKIENNRQKYGDALSLLKLRNSELLTLETALVDLNSEKKAIEQVRTVQMPNVKSEVIQQLRSKESEITKQEQLIVAKKQEIQNVNDTLTLINKDLTIVNNFTPEQKIELDPYIYEGSYRNENFIKTKIMTPVDIQEMSVQLLIQGQNQLKILSQPSYCFKMDTANFMFLKQYQVFVQALSLGCLINVESKPNEWLEPILLEINIDYDNPSECNLVFGNRFRLQTAEWTFADLYQENNNTSANVNINSNLWAEPVKSGLVDEVTSYMNNAIDLSRQDILNNKNGEVLFGEFGIRLRRKLVNGDIGYIPNQSNYDPVQVWLYNKGMGFTTDNWTTCKAFFGTITNPNGGQSTGIIAPSLVGNLIAGQQIQITNENNTFKLDGNGAELINAKFVLKTINDKTKITLDPTVGIKIQSNNNGIWKDTLYVDINGNLTLEGKIKALMGEIGGWRVDKDGLYNDNNGDYLKSNGCGKLSLLTWTPSTATFNGNIYARNLADKVLPNNLDRTYAEYAEFSELRSDVAHLDRLIANKANITDLNAVNANLRNLIADKANITDLNAVNAKIDNLNVVGKITAGSLAVNKINFKGASALISSLGRIVTDMDITPIQVLTGIVTTKNKDGAITDIKPVFATVSKINGYSMGFIDFIGISKLN